MKIAFALLLLIVPIVSQVSAVGAEPGSKAEKEVLATVDEWKQAMVKGDAAALGKLYHPDLVYEHSSAKNETKAEAIASATAAGAVSKGIELHSPVVHVYGNTATVKSTGDYTNASGSVSHLDTLMVFVKSAQGWQMVARESTKLP
ncbi:MAG: nuclear transport factor 2 family protein [Acidobacteriota bacterium]|nr:nuclear transport factor 2 family protein [Acidobacteriota bacterium]